MSVGGEGTTCARNSHWVPPCVQWRKQAFLGSRIKSVPEVLVLSLPS